MPKFRRLLIFPSEERWTLTTSHIWWWNPTTYQLLELKEQRHASYPILRWQTSLPKMHHDRYPSNTLTQDMSYLVIYSSQPIYPCATQYVIEPSPNLNNVSLIYACAEWLWGFKTELKRTTFERHAHCGPCVKHLNLGLLMRLADVFLKVNRILHR